MLEPPRVALRGGGVNVLPSGGEAVPGRRDVSLAGSAPRRGAHAAVCAAAAQRLRVKAAGLRSVPPNRLVRVVLQGQRVLPALNRVRIVEPGVLDPHFEVGEVLAAAVEVGADVGVLSESLRFSPIQHAEVQVATYAAHLQPRSRTDVANVISLTQM